MNRRYGPAKACSSAGPVPARVRPYSQPASQPASPPKKDSPSFPRGVSAPPLGRPVTHASSKSKTLGWAKRTSCRATKKATAHPPTAWGKPEGGSRHVCLRCCVCGVLTWKKHRSLPGKLLLNYVRLSFFHFSFLFYPSCILTLSLSPYLQSCGCCEEHKTLT